MAVRDAAVLLLLTEMALSRQDGFRDLDKHGERASVTSTGLHSLSSSNSVHHSVHTYVEPEAQVTQQTR